MELGHHRLQHRTGTSSTTWSWSIIICNMDWSIIYSMELEHHYHLLEHHHMQHVTESSSPEWIGASLCAVWNIIISINTNTSLTLIARGWLISIRLE